VSHISYPHMRGTISYPPPYQSGTILIHMTWCHRGRGNKVIHTISPSLSMAYPPWWGSPLPYPPHYDILTGHFGGLIPSMKFSGKIFGKRGVGPLPPLLKTHIFLNGNISYKWGVYDCQYS
jgi:hypothetical protein